MARSGRGAPEPTPAPEEKELSFSDLVPSRQPRSLYPHLKTLDGRRVKMVDLGRDGTDEKTGYYVVLDNGEKYAIPLTIAKKLQIGLKNAAAKGQKYIPGTIKGRDRGVNIS